MENGHSEDALTKSLTETIRKAIENERERIYLELASEQDVRAHAKKKSTTRIGAMILTSLLTAGWGSYELILRPRETAEVKRTEMLDRAIYGNPEGQKKEEKRGLVGRLDSAEQRIERLGDLHFDQRSLILDVRQELADKLDAVSPRARNVSPADSVEEAQRQVDAYRKRQRAKEADAALRKGDPFSGIE